MQYYNLGYPLNFLIYLFILRKILCIVVYNIFNGEFKLEPVRISYGLDLKTGLDSGPISSNNEFVECGRKN